MKKSRILFLLLINGLVIFSSCGPKPYHYLQNTAPDPKCRLSLKPEFTSALYSTKVDVVGLYITGLLLFKSMPDGSTRVVFTNEVGIKLFDFEFFENEFRVLHCVKKLNKTVVLRALRKDIGMLLQAGFDYNETRYYKSDSLKYIAFVDGNEITYLISDPDCNSLLGIEYASRKRTKVKMNLTGSGKGLPDSAYIAHQAFKFNISLKKVNVSNGP